MVTIPRDRAAHKSVISTNAIELARIVGFTCVAGFVSDMLVAMMPVVVRSEQWRMNLLQQMGDRGIILLFGLSLLSLGYAGRRLWDRRVGVLSLAIGVLFLLFCLLFVRDSLLLQETANSSVDTQASELQSRLQEQSDSELSDRFSSEQIAEARQQINLQAESFKQEVRTSAVRLGLSALSNLLIMGVAFIGLGRYCLRSRRI